MSALRLILGDQLSHEIATLRDLGADDTVLLCEVMQEATYVAHHPKKIAFQFAAMRHFAQDLRARGVQVRYVTLDAPGNSGDFSGEVARAVQALSSSRLIVTEPGEYRVRQMISGWEKQLGLPVEIREDERFLCSHALFAQWAQGRKQLRMEYFYRMMRERTGLLIEPDGTPTGGRWNFDQQNRKPPAKGMQIPPRLRHPPTPILREVLALVAARFGGHFGALEPFHLAVTRTHALADLGHFIEHILPQFGDYQDVMLHNEAALYHSLLSTSLNAGLLSPMEICLRAQDAYRAGRAPINAVEGFIRQILGWREFVRGIYWRLMPEYGQRNFLNAVRPLPPLYWGGHTHMNCLAQAVAHTRDHAYSHHIQRLMVTGNFALLAGLDVAQVQAWYLAVYSDAYEWVEMPNTLGMALYGDGGEVASKPYAASGKYIRKMSNFCDHCQYDPDEMLGERACPFNALYWDFFARHRPVFARNHRLPYVYATWDRFTPARRQAITQKAAEVLDALQQGTL